MNQSVLVNIDTLIDIAEQLVERQPYEGYVLLKLAQEECPDHPRIHRLLNNIKPTTLVETIVAWRHDGLCERLSAILLGHASATATGLNFKFVWPDLSLLERKFQVEGSKWHDVPAQATDILSQDFCNSYQIGELEILHPASEFDFSCKLYRKFILNSFDKLIQYNFAIKPCWLASNRIFPDLRSEFDNKYFYNLLMSDILSPEIQSETKEAQRIPLPSKRIALHVRGGDIVYGDTRLSHGFGRVKSLSLPVAERICEIYSEKGYSILLFGATLSDLRYLSSKFSSTIIYADLLSDGIPGSTKMVQELFAMSDCQHIISSTDTAVTQLASLLGRATLLPINAVISEQDEYNFLRSYMTKGKHEAFSKLQSAFVYWNIFVLSDGRSDYHERLSYLYSASENDPRNMRFKSLIILLEILCQKDDQAKRGINELFADYGVNSQQGSFLQILKEINLPLRNPLILNILKDIRKMSVSTKFISDKLIPVFKEVKMEI